jgi:hypothetical protein
VDTALRQIAIGETPLAYDFLIIGTGARHSYFGHDDWAAAAPGLKGIDDALDIRRRLLLAFEAAESSQNEAERRAWLTFIIVGGGPTGVELAGAIAELARHGLTREFRMFDPANARIVLVQAADRVLPTFPSSLSAAAKRSLAALGVEVLTSREVKALDGRGADVGGEWIAARTVVWAAGVTASPVAAWLGVETDRAGRVRVGPDLRVPGRSEIFVIGDTATCNAWRGHAGARPGASCEAGRRIRSQSNPGCSRRPSRAAAVPLPPLWKPCHDWTAGGGRGLRRSSGARRAGMVALGHGPHCLFDRCAQPHDCSGYMALGLLDLPARQPPHHRCRTLRTGRTWSAACTVLAVVRLKARGMEITGTVPEQKRQSNFGNS